MSTVYRITQEDCEDLGFFASCVGAQAIFGDEPNQWLYAVIAETKDVPSYIFELIDIDLKTVWLEKIVGFVPHWIHTSSEAAALDGIAYLRGAYDRPLSYDIHIGRDEAVAALHANPQITERFKSAFPFVQFPFERK